MIILHKRSLVLGAFLITLGGSMLPALQARADLQITSSTMVGNLFTYDLNFSNSIDAATGLPTQRLQSGNYATLYDIDGFNSAMLTPGFSTLFTLSTATVGQTPAGVTPTDTALTNVTLTYTGPTMTLDHSFLDILHVTSSFTTADASGQYTGLTTKNTGAAAGTDIAAIGNVAVPGTPRNPNATNTPEPGALALLIGLGMSGTGLFARRRKRTRKAS